MGAGCAHHGRRVVSRPVDAAAPPDAATRAVAEWVRTWRETAGAASPRPPGRFARVLGAEAVAMARSGVGVADMVRIFSAAGRDLASPSGVPAGGRCGGQMGLAAEIDGNQTSTTDGAKA